MDLTFSPQEIAFRDELRAWLVDNRPEAEPTEGGEDAHYAWRRDWQRRLYDAGWAAPAWPTQDGGGGVGAPAVPPRVRGPWGGPHRVGDLLRGDRARACPPPGERARPSAGRPDA